MNARPSRQRGKLRRSLALLSVVVALGAVASPGCGNSGLVGGGCADGLTNCSNRCVDLDTDQFNCGHCGNQCQSGIACVYGKCGGEGPVGGSGYGGQGGDSSHYRDGSAGTGLTSQDAQGDHVVEFDVGYPQGGSTNTGGSNTGGSNTGGSNTGSSNTGGSNTGGSNTGLSSGGNAGSSNGGSAGSSNGGDAGSSNGGDAGSSNGGNAGSASGGADAGEVDPCTPPYNDALHCGDCTTVCPQDTPVCAPSAGSFVCRPICDPPLINCGGTCADLNSDATNCGVCGKYCPSGACQLGGCVGARPGHVVSICMNYRTAPGPLTTQTTRLLGNSLFLPRVPTVKILAYDEFADANVRQQVNSTIAAASSLIGQLYSITHVSSSTDVLSMLNISDYDVFLIYEQPKASTGALSDIGSLWESTLKSFSYVGGVIVILDGGQGVREMSQFITSTHLLTVDSEVMLAPGTQLANRALGDQVAAFMTDKFPCQADTCAFETPELPNAYTTFVTTEPDTDAASGRPVVIHMTRIAP